MKLQEFTKVAEMLAKEHRIQIKEGRAWAANIKSRVVFYVKNDIYNLPEEHILGLLLHEIAHIHYTKDFELPAKNKELAHSALNMLEDISIENIISKDYPNAGEILNSTKKDILDTLMKILPKITPSIYEKSLLYAAIRFEGRGYDFGVEPYEKMGNKIVTVMRKNKKILFERKETKDLLPMVEEIVNLLTKEIGEPTDEDKNSMTKTNNQNGNIQEQESIRGKIIQKLKSNGGWEGNIATSNQITFIDKIADQASRIGKQLRTVLKRNNAMEFGGRYRTGKLLAKRFVRVKALKDRHPFARRIVKSNQSYAFAIASDISGSMFNCGGLNDPGSYALSSMYMAGEALRYASIHRAMAVFGVRARIIAPIGKSQIRWEQIADEKNIRSANQNGTNIAAAMNLCAQELKKIQAERKIMITITDRSSSLWDMKEAHKKAVAENIECLGITIGSGSASKYMDETFSKAKNITIADTTNTDLIGKAFIDILKASVAKSL